ncbi:hypothetical protein AC481_05770 [miscellaneous Crenarchaeota group archaeon SMTZ-80]|nr:MAG: hypothetical protein AC481_05770 [miscellaneous Crenarchaeota group archaeon SMTZ-80]
MSKKKGILDDIVKAIFSLFFDKMFKNIQDKMNDYILEVVRPYISDIASSIIKKIIIAIIGASLAVIGILFLCMSMVRYLSIYISPWMAWGLVGLIILIVGFILSMIGIRK